MWGGTSLGDRLCRSRSTLEVVSGAGGGGRGDTFAIGIREIVVVNIDSSSHCKRELILSYADAEDVFGNYINSCAASGDIFIFLPHHLESWS